MRKRKHLSENNSVRLVRIRSECVRKSISTNEYVIASSAMHVRHAHAGVKLIVQAELCIGKTARKYIYRYACMVVWEMWGCMCGMCMSV